MSIEQNQPAADTSLGPLVTIVIPCWNAERFIADAIHSALAQTYKNKEIVVIDDGSTDRSLAVIQSFGRAVRWETGPNRGGSAARNRGVVLARGDLIQFLDADDLLASEKLQRQVPLLLEDNRLVVYCDAVDLDLVSGAVRTRSPREHDHFRVCCFDRIGTPGPIHWKAALVEIGGFDETLPCAQEFDLHLRLACRGFRFQRLPRALVTYRRTASGVSTDYVRVLKCMGSIVQKVGTLMKLADENYSERRRALSEVLAHAAVQLLDRGHDAWCKQYLLLARDLHPSGGMQIFAPQRRIIYKSLGVERSHPMLHKLTRLWRTCNGSSTRRTQSR